MDRDVPETSSTSGNLSVEPPPNKGFDDISGLSQVKKQLKEAVVIPATEEHLLAFGASGVLIHGPTGVGKTRLAKALLGETNLTYIELTPADVPLSDLDEGAEFITTVFQTALEQSPCAVFVDGLDVFAPADGGTAHHSQVAEELCHHLDELDNREEQVLFLATCTEVAEINERVRRPGRIDLTTGIRLPDTNRRQAILDDELSRVAREGVSLSEDLQAADIAETAEGFSAAALVELVDRAVRASHPDDNLATRHLASAAREVADNRDIGDDTGAGLGDLFGESDDEEDEDEDIDFGQFVPNIEDDDEDTDGTDDDGTDDEAETETDDGEDSVIDDEDVHGREEGGRGVVVADDESLDATFDDIGGLSDVKHRLRELIEWPRQYPDQFEALGVDTAKGILLYGPPGTGKTLLAQAVASETESTFLSIAGPTLLDKYVGESERFVRDVFDTARENAPSIVFFDEFDAVAGQRGGYVGGDTLMDSIVNQLLSELDGLVELDEVVVIAATNRIDVIDPALKRPGRFGEAIHVPPPDDEGRKQVFEIHLRDRPIADDVTVEWLVEQTDRGFTGADIEQVCDRAAMYALRELVEDRSAQSTNTQLIERGHFERAIRSIDTSGNSSTAADPRGFR